MLVKWLKWCCVALCVRDTHRYMDECVMESEGLVNYKTEKLVGRKWSIAIYIWYHKWYAIALLSPRICLVCECVVCVTLFHFFRVQLFDLHIDQRAKCTHKYIVLYRFPSHLIISLCTYLEYEHTKSPALCVPVPKFIALLVYTDPLINIALKKKEVTPSVPEIKIDRRFHYLYEVCTAESRVYMRRITHTYCQTLSAEERT